MGSRLVFERWSAALSVAAGMLPACGGSDSTGTDGQLGRTGAGGEGGHSSPDGSSARGGATFPDGSSSTDGSITPDGSRAPDGSSSVGPLEHCVDPAPVVVDGSPTGFVACAGGVVHRPEILDCPVLPPRTEACAADDINCSLDSDCAHLELGRCLEQPSGDFGAICTCMAGCVRDADCEPGKICMCGDPVGTCVRAACASDADCQGLPCMSYRDVCWNVGGFACRTPADSCAPGSGCDGCGPWDGTAWSCQSAVCGRPFIIDGRARLADLATRADWREGRLPSPPSSDPEVLAKAGAHWARAALAEHASIGAFGRFVLQLLRLGAPADLLARAQLALGDEIRHATLCFEVASAYDGERSLGPGPLDVSGALESLTIDAIVVDAVREGCIGETLAALEAAEAAAYVEDDHMRSVLETIARDELEHAGLAWRFAAWAIQTGLAPAAAVGAILEQELDGLIASRVEPEPQAEQLLVHGVVTGAAREELRRRAVEEVLRPHARALCAGDRALAA